MDEARREHPHRLLRWKPYPKGVCLRPECRYYPLTHTESLLSSQDVRPDTRCELCLCHGDTEMPLRVTPPLMTRNVPSEHRRRAPGERRGRPPVREQDPLQEAGASAPCNSAGTGRGPFPPLLSGGSLTRLLPTALHISVIAKMTDRPTT